MKWAVRKAAFVLIGSVSLNLALFWGGFFLYQFWLQKQILDQRFWVSSIIQTGPEREALKTAYLAELLHLSTDRPVSLYSIDCEKAEKWLLQHPLIEKVKIKKIFPSTLYIDYKVRKPIAEISDFQNVGIDETGALLPLAPFYTPKNLPRIYLGLAPFDVSSEALGHLANEWRLKLDNPYLQLSLEILKVFRGAEWQEGVRLVLVDVSNAFAKSAGEREIVLKTEDEMTLRQKEDLIVFHFPKILRLPLKEYLQQLSNFLTLRLTMLEDYRHQLASMHFIHSPVEFAPRIIDMRIADFAYVQNN